MKMRGICGFDCNEQYTTVVICDTDIPISIARALTYYVFGHIIKHLKSF